MNARLAHSRGAKTRSVRSSSSSCFYRCRSSESFRCILTCPRLSDTIVALLGFICSVYNLAPQCFRAFFRRLNLFSFKLLSNRRSLCVLLKDTSAQRASDFTLHFQTLKSSRQKVRGRQACSILPLLCEKTVEVVMKSLCCWITDELIFQASGFINALSADCHIASTGGRPQPSRVVHKMIPLERSPASLQPSDPVSACLRQHGRASFPEVNCPSSMSGDGSCERTTRHFQPHT